MDKQKLETFLKGYVDVLRENVDIRNDFPLSFRASMPGGCALVDTRDGRRVCAISVEGGNQSSSMPVSSVDLTYARLITDLLNGWAELQASEEAS